MTSKIEVDELLCACGHARQEHWIVFDEDDLEEYFRCRLCICSNYNSTAIVEAMMKNDEV